MDHEQRFDVLAHVVEIANASVEVHERLDSILGTINKHLGSRLAVLFLQETAKKPTDPGQRLAPAKHVAATPWRWPLARARWGRAARDREPQLVQVSLPNDDPALDALCQEGELATLFPVMDDNRLYAVLLLVFEPGRAMDTDEVLLLQMVSREMAGTIRNHRLYFEAKRRITELNVISELGRAAVSTIELDELLDTVAGMVAKLLGAKGGQGVHQRPPPTTLPGCTPCSARCLRSALISRNAWVSAICTPRMTGAPLEGGGQAKGMCVPLSFKGNYNGHLCVFEKMVLDKDAVPRFNVEDHNLLVTMASMISSALEKRPLSSSASRCWPSATRRWWAPWPPCTRSAPCS